MSLLMQALKKAERARQSGLQEEEIPNDQSGLHGASGDEAPLPEPAPAAREPKAPSAPLELSLEPLDDRPQPRAHGEQPPPPPPPPIEPAVEAAHNPVPPQARHEGGRSRPAADEVPVADARAAPRPGNPQPDRRSSGAPERRAAPRTAAVSPDSASAIDMGRLRVAGLSVMLVLVAGTFGYLYWQGVSGPGPGASLPMVPMPPPSATGATNAGGDGSIVVAPAGPPFGPLGAPGAMASGPPAEPAAAPAEAPAMPEAATAPAASPPPAAPARPSGSPARRGGATTSPTPAQLAEIADPEIRREAMRDAMERAERESRTQASNVPQYPDSGVARPAGEAVPAPAQVGGTGGADVQVARGTDVQVARGTAAPAIIPEVQGGYAAFTAGDLAMARRQYAAALRRDPHNRDALLGSAAVAVREQRDEEAAGYYARLLAANPRDTEGIAGLAALRPGDGDRAEIRLKGVLRNNPEAASVHFALGNLYARQARWQEAQQAYFRAWTAAPSNADYAFNLAVGLDRLNQGRLARDYYQRALSLAADGAAAFDRAAVQRRLLELAPAAPPLPAAPAARAVPEAPATRLLPESPGMPAAAGN